MTATTSVPATAIEVGTWSVDALHSTAEFRVRHFGIAWFTGEMADFSLDLEVDADGPVAARGVASVDAIDIKNEQLLGHLASPDFFDAELYPSITFTSDSVQLASDGAATVDGELTMKGVTQPLTLRGTWSGPVVDMAGSDRIGLELTGKIDRDAFGISWAATLTGGIPVLGPTVELRGAFELVRQ